MRRSLYFLVYKTAQKVSKIKHSKKPQRKKPEKIATKNLAGIQRRQSKKYKIPKRTVGVKSLKLYPTIQKKRAPSKGNWLKKKATTKQDTTKQM